MTRTLIIEDEKLAANRMIRLLEQKHPSYVVEHTIETVREGVAFLKENSNNIDLIFCDIHLADGKSFEIFEQVKVTTPIIFTTAYDEYSLDAFDVNSIHYLLKPIDELDLTKALAKYEERGSGKKDLEMILSKVGQTKTRRFLLRSGRRFIPKKESELAYFYTHNKIVHAADLQEGKVFVTDFTLEQLESELLSRQHFFRINRKHLVNKEAIKELRPFKNQRLSLALTVPCKEELILSREKVNSFKEWFTDH